MILHIVWNIRSRCVQENRKTPHRRAMARMAQRTADHERAMAERSCAKRYDRARSRSRRRRFKCFIMRPTASAWSWGPRTGDGPAFGHRPSMSCHVAWREWPALSHQQIGIDWRTCFLTFSLTVRLPEQNCKMTRDGE